MSDEIDSEVVRKRIRAAIREARGIRASVAPDAVGYIDLEAMEAELIRRAIEEARNTDKA